MLRELVISEAMHALGIPTSRSLAVVSTGEPVYRERTLPGAVLTRVAASHVRVGTFEWAAAHRDPAALRALADYTLRRHYPDAAAAAMPVRGVLRRRRRTAGRAHRAVAARGLRARRDEHRQHVAGGRDHRLRAVRVHRRLRSRPRCSAPSTPLAATPMASSRPSRSGIWRGSPRRCCRSSTPTRRAPSSWLTHRIARFETRFQHHWLTGMRAKLGLLTEEPEDAALADGLLTWMQGTARGFHQHVRSSLDAGRGRGDCGAAMPRSLRGTRTGKRVSHGSPTHREAVTAAMQRQQSRRDSAQSPGGSGPHRGHRHR